jgi:hypothetical protein
MAIYTYYRYTTNNQYVINGGPTVVTIDDADGLIAANSTFVASGTTYTLKGYYTANSTNFNAGDFTADTGGSGRFFFSSKSTLTNGLDADSQANFTTSGSVSLTCFLEGTRVLTEAGEVPVEELVIGQNVVTADGRKLPIRWVGKQTCLRLFSRPEHINPIRIMAGALGENVPTRDLYVSPDHAMLVDGMLVNASALVNGTTITQVPEMPKQFFYYHIETAEHCAILAEGAPAETFVDNVTRLRFDNWEQYEALYPQAQPIPEMGLPRVSAARLLPARIRQRIAERACLLFGACVRYAA